MKNTYLLIASLLLLAGCGNGTINIVGVQKFEAPKELYEGYTTPPRLFLDIEGGDEDEACEVDFPIDVLKNKQAIDESGIVPTLSVTCDYDGISGVGDRVDSEYEYVKLKFLEGNKAVISVKAKLMVSSEDRYYETQTVKPLEFEYAY